MSQEPHSHDEGPIQTPKQLAVAIVLAFVLPVAIIALLVTFVSSASKSSAGSDALTPEATAQRIMPVASVQIKAAAANPGSATGEDVYKAQCAACHGAGTLGAPKLGDAAAWAGRIGQGLEALWNAAMKGKGAMPPQAGGDFNGDEIKRAVAYMANSGGAKFDVPAPTAAAPAGDAASGATTTITTANAAATPVAAAVAPASAVTAAPATVAAAPTAVAGAVPVLYQNVCAVCHTAGVANAPKPGDKAAWAPRLAAGLEGLTASAIKGKGAMPPKGGATNATEAEIKQAVAYMIQNTK